MKGFPFIKSPNSYIKSELTARKNPINASLMRPWISVTSNLGPSGKTLASETYNSLFGENRGGYSTSDVVKYKPKPLVTDFSIDFSSRGTLRKGTIKIKCFTIPQLTEIQKYFMEPGISVFVQWGWSRTGGGAAVAADSVDATTQRTYYRKYDALQGKRDKTNGCYDNMLGIISKADASVSDEDFIVTVKIVSLGELLAGRSQSGVETPSEENKNEANKYSFKDIILLRVGSDLDRVKVNWCYFFNQLPDQFKTHTIKNWGETHTNHSTDFINFDEVWIEDVKSETGEGSIWEFYVNNSFKFLGKTFYAEDSENPISPKKYVKFSAFIDLLNEIAKTKTTKGELINSRIDIGTKTNPVTICAAFPTIFSVDDSVFIPNEAASNWYNKSPYYLYAEVRDQLGPLIIDNSIHSLNGEKVSFPINATSINVAGTNYTFPAKTFGWIGDLYIDNDLVIESLKNTSGDIKDMLDSLLKEMSEATDGMWNFQCRQDDSDKYRLIIVDGNLMNSPNGGIDPLNLPYHGPDSVFLNASFNFDIPKGMANRIVMQRANKDKVSEQPGLRGLFSNNTDIVITDDFIAEETKDDSSKKPLIDEEKEKLDNWKGFRQFSRILVQPIISRLGVNTIGQDISDYLVPGNCSNNELFNALRKQGVENGQLASSSPLPLKINFTVMGISGFQFGDMLIIDGLPSQYTSGNGAFMVTEITHKVDDSMWTTDVEAMFRPYMKP